MGKPTEKKILLDCRDVSLGYEGQALWQGLTFQVRSGFLNGRGAHFFYTAQEKSTALMHMGKLGIL